ncbi:hypothetical protein [Legionella quateirensis]|uniref:hypothetical protein n=1 Tax=Legionella quateirensis TaxID=45072 RepID=UPI000730998F|nr:hypothetical protein [Legionella quateirensis]
MAHLARSLEQKNAHVPYVHSAFFIQEIVQPALKASRSVSFYSSLVHHASSIEEKMVMYLMYTPLFLFKRSCNLHSNPAVQFLSIVLWFIMHPQLRKKWSCTLCTLRFFYSRDRATCTQIQPFSLWCALAHLARSIEQKNAHVPYVHSAFFIQEIVQPVLKL